MEHRNSLISKLLSQVLTLLFSAALLCFALSHKPDDIQIFDMSKNIQTYNMFFGAFLAMFGFGLVNIIFITITHNSEITIQKKYTQAIVDKVSGVMLSGIKINSNFFDDVISNVLSGGSFGEINILAHTSERFLGALKKIEFSCDTLNIVIQEAEIDGRHKVITDWRALLKDSEKAKHINIYKTRKDSDKLLFGMIVDGRFGMIGFYNPVQTSTLHSFGIDVDVHGHSALLDVVERWYDYYRDEETVLDKITKEEETKGI